MLLVVDLLHEFELGVWKALLLHLIRVLYTQGADATQATGPQLPIGDTIAHPVVVVLTQAPPQLLLDVSGTAEAGPPFHLTVTQALLGHHRPSDPIVLKPATGLGDPLVVERLPRPPMMTEMAQAARRRMTTKPRGKY